MINLVLNSINNLALECPPHHLISKEKDTWVCKKCNKEVKILYENSKYIRVENNT